MRINISEIMDNAKNFVNAHKKAVIIATGVVVAGAIAIGVASAIGRSDNDVVAGNDTTIVDETTINEETTGAEDTSTDTAVEDETTVPEDTTVEETTVPETEPETTVPGTEATTKAPDTTKAPETTKVPETQNSWLGAPEVVVTAPIETTPESAAVETRPEDKVGTKDPLTGKTITVVETYEKTSSDGRKVIVTVYSDGTTSKIVECEYCHEFPCPNGGKENCTKYDISKDYSKTCSECGRLFGDGYNETCLAEYDWNTGEYTCHHYDE